VLHEHVREQVDALRLHDRVIVGRGAEQCDGVYVTRALHPLPRFETAVGWKRGPVDLTPSLLRVWSLPALSEWYTRTHGISDSPVSLPETATAATLRGISEGLARQAERSAEIAEQSRINRDFVESVRRGVTHPAPNGKPKG